MAIYPMFLPSLNAASGLRSLGAFALLLLIVLTEYGTAAPLSIDSRAGLSGAAYPFPTDAELSAIQTAAQGMLPNLPLPGTLSPSSLTAFQIIIMNEHFETAFFESLVSNITNSAPGYELEIDGQTQLLDVLTRILAQEKLHSLAAANVLARYSTFIPEPCRYRFPVKNLLDAVQMAEVFTALVLGALQDAAERIARNGDIGVVRMIASIMGQEGEQNGFYRMLQARMPSEQPFLTTSVAAFSMSALQNYIIPGSCPFPLSNINVTIVPTLDVLTSTNGNLVGPFRQPLTFRADLSNSSLASPYIGGNMNGTYVTYLGGLGLPISMPVSGPRWSGNVVTFTAIFPFDDRILFGTSFAALTTGNGYTGATSVVQQTLAGPGLITVSHNVMLPVIVPQ